MSVISDLRKSILDAYRDNKVPLSPSEQITLAQKTNLHDLGSWLYSYSVKNNTRSNFENTLLGNVINAYLDESMKKAFPGFTGSIQSYDQYKSYTIGTFQRSAANFVQLMKDDKVLAKFVAGASSTVQQPTTTSLGQLKTLIEDTYKTNGMPLSTAYSTQLKRANSKDAVWQWLYGYMTTRPGERGSDGQVITKVFEQNLLKRVNMSIENDVASGVLPTAPIAITTPPSQKPTPTPAFVDFTDNEINTMYRVITNSRVDKAPGIASLKKIANDEHWSRDTMVNELRNKALSTKAISQDEYNRQLGVASVIATNQKEDLKKYVVNYIGSILDSNPSDKVSSLLNSLKSDIQNNEMFSPESNTTLDDVRSFINGRVDYYVGQMSSGENPNVAHIKDLVNIWTPGVGASSVSTTSANLNDKNSMKSYVVGYINRVLDSKPGSESTNLLTQLKSDIENNELFSAGSGASIDDIRIFINGRIDYYQSQGSNLTDSRLDYIRNAANYWSPGVSMITPDPSTSSQDTGGFNGTFTAKNIQDIYAMITDGRDYPDSAESLADDYNLVNHNSGGEFSWEDAVNDLMGRAKISGDVQPDGSAWPRTDNNPGGSGAPVAGTSGNGTGSTGSSSGSSSSSTPTRKFRLIRGDGSPAGADQLRNNGNAVFLVSDSGELFHVTEQLADQMQKDGTWYEPEVLPQAQVNSMTLRMSLNFTAELGVLKVPSNGEFFLVKGDGPALSTSQLNGNGDAVYAIDRNGNKFHVTGAVAEEMQKAGTWMTPAVLNQGTIDNAPLKGALASASGGVTELTIPPVASGATISTPIASPAPTSAPSTVSSSSANVVKNLFRQYVGREADANDLRIHGSALDSGKTVDQLRDELAVAPESANFRQKLVTETFRQYVGREADAEDLRIHTQNLMSGQVTPDEFRFGIATAPEAVTYQEKVVGGLSQQSQAMYAEAINKIFQDNLGRGASAEDVRIHAAGLTNGAITLDQLNAQISQSPESQLFRGEAPVTKVTDAPVVATAPVATPTVSSAPTPTQNNSFKLVRGNGPNMGNKQLTGNGAAVYAVFDGGKKLHVTAAMAEQLVKDGKWEEPTVIDQNELDSTPVAGTLADTNGRVGSLEVPLVETPVPASNGTMRTEIKDPMPVAVSGGGTSSSSSAPAPTTSTPTTTPKPAWTPDDVVDKTGEKRDLMDPKYGYDSVQERIEVKNHIYQSKGTFQELDQIAAIYDSKDPQRIDDWERFSHTGKYAPGATPDVAPVAAVAVAAPAPSTPVNNFKLVRGNGPGLGNSHLLGNGAAVYAIFDNGTKLHVTGAMAGELQNQHRWVEPEVWDQNTLDQTPPQGRMVDVNGGVGSLEVQWLPPAPATPSPDPVIPPAAPAPTPQPETPVDFAWDRNGVARNLFDPSLHYDTPEEREKVRASVTHGGSWEEVDQVGAIYDSQDPVAIDNWERFSSTGKYSVDTPWGAEYRKAITEGIDHNTAVYWCNSKYGIF